MIEVIYDRGVPSISASGHAGYALAGQDIVCAGVSALLETLAMYATDVHDKGNFVISGGDTSLYDFAAGGIAEISEKYPENVIITYV